MLVRRCTPELYSQHHKIFFNQINLNEEMGAKINKGFKVDELVDSLLRPCEVLEWSRNLAMEFHRTPSSAGWEEHRVLSLSEEGCNMVVKLPKSSTFTW
jgi:hypothetical protein